MLQFYSSPNSTVPSQIGQKLVRPCVYFDHWAFVKFSRDEQLGARFARILHDREGTIALSILNLLEFSGLTDIGQAKAAERFLESLLPRLFFMRFSPNEVRVGEVERWTGQTVQSPAGDVQLLRQFGLPMAEGRGPFHARGLFAESVRQRDYLQQLIKKLAETAQEDYREYRAKHPLGPEFTRMIKTELKKVVGHPRPTGALRIALIEQQFLQAQPVLDAHDAIDMLHTVVPAAYCQLVLLDGRWCDLVDRAQRRLTRAGISGVARAFSDRNNGVGRFLEALQAHPRGAPPSLPTASEPPM